MADETLQDSQQEAIKKNELPTGALLEQTPVEDYQKENAQVKDQLAEFGQTDLEKFMTKVTSDSVYGKQVLRKMLGLDEDKPLVDLVHKTSPQENNGEMVHTGVLDRSVFPPRIKGGPEGKTSDKVGTVAA